MRSRNRILKTAAALLLLHLAERKTRIRSCWVKPWLSRRKSLGTYFISIFHLFAIHHGLIPKWCHKTRAKLTWIYQEIARVKWTALEPRNIIFLRNVRGCYKHRLFSPVNGHPVAAGCLDRRIQVNPGKWPWRHWKSPFDHFPPL